MHAECRKMRRRRGKENSYAPSDSHPYNTPENERREITHHVDQLHESEAEIHVHLLCHVLHRSNEFVVSSEQVSHQSFLILGTETCETRSINTQHEREMKRIGKN